MAAINRQKISPLKMKAAYLNNSRQKPMISIYCRNSDTLKSLPADRLGISSTVGILVLVLAITALIFVFLDSGFRSAADHQEECLQLVRALGLNSLSLAPSGRPLRNPGAIDPPIDLRFDPKLGRIYLDGAEFVLKVSD